MTQPLKAPPDDVLAAADKHWQDMEIFFGKLHTYKNVPTGGKSCGDGACVIERPKHGVKTLTLDATSRPAPIGFSVYGAGWCRFCRAAKLLLAESGREFKYVDIEALGDKAAVIAALGVEQSTIPIVYNDGQLLGGFDDTAAFIAQSAGDAAAHDAMVARATEAARETVVRFDKLGHSASVSLLHGWGMNDERVIAREDGALINAALTLANVPDSATITVYVVGGPDVKAAEGQAGGASFEVLSVTPSGAAADGAESAAAPRMVATPMAGRHLAACVTNGSTLHLRCPLSFCLYSLYVTDEPPASAGADRAVEVS